MNGYKHPVAVGQATDAQRQLQQIADLVDEYAELAEPTGNADLITLLFQIRMVLGDNPPS
jgi:hypothetical protein